MSASRRWRRNRLRHKAAEPTCWHWGCQVYNSENRILKTKSQPRQSSPCSPNTPLCSLSSCPVSRNKTWSFITLTFWEHPQVRGVQAGFGNLQDRLPASKDFAYPAASAWNVAWNLWSDSRFPEGGKRKTLCPTSQAAASFPGGGPSRCSRRAVGKGSWGPFKLHNKRASRQAGRLKHTALFNKTADRPSLAPPRSPC